MSLNNKILLEGPPKMVNTILQRLVRNREDWVFRHPEETVQENKALEEHLLTAKDHQQEVTI